MMNRILLNSTDIAPDDTAILTGAQARHAQKVLQATVGQVIRIGILNGSLGIGTVMSASETDVQLACEFDSVMPTRPTIDLLLALPRPKVMRRLWAQLAAIGVHRILLTNAAKVERMYFDSHVLEPDVYQPLLIEGLQQAGDTWMPEVSMVRRFKPMVEDELDLWFPDGIRLIADPAGMLGILDTVTSTTPHPSRILLAIGPEGGWTPYEIDLMREHGFHPVSAGPRTLRSDTACIALLTLAHQALASRTL